MRTAESYLNEYCTLTAEIQAFKETLNKNIHHEESLDFEEFLDIEALIIKKQIRKKRVSQILADAFGLVR